MTTQDIESAIAFAKTETHEGDLRCILLQGKFACRTLVRALEDMQRRVAELEAEIEQLQHQIAGDWLCDGCDRWFSSEMENLGVESHLCQTCVDECLAAEQE